MRSMCANDGTCRANPPPHAGMILSPLILFYFYFIFILFLFYFYFIFILIYSILFYFILLYSIIFYFISANLNVDAYKSAR